MYSTEYNRLYLLYLSVNESSDLVEACTNILCIHHTSYNTSKMIARSLFHMSRSDVRNLGALSAQDANNFSDDIERKSRDIIVGDLSQYIKSLETFSYGDNKIKSLLAYLISESLFSILGNLYIPAEIRGLVNNCLDVLNERSERLLTDTINYFKAKEIPELTNTITSLGNLLLIQRTDQVMTILNKVSSTENEDGTINYKLDNKDFVFLQDQGFYFRKLNGKVELGTILELLGLSSTTYQRSKKVVVEDIATKFTESSVELLTDILFRNR